jgi:glucose/mannose-6-phosphate isomerase
MIKQHDLDSVDKLGMYKIYDKWPEIAESAFNSDLEEISFDKIDHIVFSGMGGSGAIGDLFSSILSKSDIHVSTVKGYLLPKTVDKNTLVITTSVSGNTDETLTVLSNAKKLDCNLLAFSSGGKMEEFCKKTQINFRKLNLIHSPRASFVNFTYSIFKTLGSVLPIEKNGILESINELTKTRDQISSSNLSDSNPAVSLANWISEIPLIYYPHGLQSSAIRFKASLQENAKTHAIIEDVIESCHNGVVAWERPSLIQPILLRGQDDYIKTKERFEIVKEYFIENNIEFKEIFSVSGNILTKLINLIYLLDYTSIYYSVLSDIDPSPVTSIEFMKSRTTNL